MNRDTFRLLGKILRAIGAVVFITSFTVTLGLGGYFTSFPRMPDPQRGLIVGHNIHGTHYYITPQLQSAFDWAFNIGFYSVALIALGIYLIRENAARNGRGGIA